MKAAPAEILARYKQLRAVQRAVNGVLTKTLSRKAIEETARRVGLWEGGRIVFDDEREVDVLNDAAIYDYFPSGKKNAVERHASQDPYEPGSDERLVLEAMGVARVTLVELGTIVRDVGVLANDIVFGGDLLLADVGLSETAQQGMVLVTRLLEFEAFSMTTGVARDFDPELAVVVAKSFRETVIRGVPAGALDAKTRSRLGRLLFHFSSLEPDDAHMQLAGVAAAGLPEGDPRRAAFQRELARRQEEAT